MPNIKGDDGALKTIFSNSKIIAVVGHSEKSSLASYQVAKFLQAVGYRKFGLKPRPLRTALSYNGKSDNQAKN